MISFHKGLTSELRRRMQLTGVQIDDAVAQGILRGDAMLVDKQYDSSALRDLRIMAIENASDILNTELRFELMREWEQEHPDDDPFPQPLALQILHIIEVADPEDAVDTLAAVLRLVKNELYG